MQDEWQMLIINVEEKQIITGKDDIKTEQGRKGVKHVRYRIWSSAKAGQKTVPGFSGKGRISLSSGVR